MRQKLATLVLLLFMFICMAEVAFASEPGDLVTVTVTVKNAGEAMGVEVSYPSELIYVSASPSVGFAGSKKWGQAQLSPIGTATCVYTFRVAETAAPGVYYVTATLDSGTGSPVGGSVTVGNPVHVHTRVIIKGKAATCTEAGLTDGEKCSVCG